MFGEQPPTVFEVRGQAYPLTVFHRQSFPLELESEGHFYAERLMQYPCHSLPHNPTLHRFQFVLVEFEAFLPCVALEMMAPLWVEVAGELVLLLVVTL